MWTASRKRARQRGLGRRLKHAKLISSVKAFRRTLPEMWCERLTSKQTLSSCEPIRILRRNTSNIDMVPPSSDRATMNDSATYLPALAATTWPPDTATCRTVLSETLSLLPTSRDFATHSQFKFQTAQSFLIGPYGPWTGSCAGVCRSLHFSLIFSVSSGESLANSISYGASLVF